MAEKMMAVVKTRPEMGADLLEVDMPMISDDEVLIKVRATSICGTDIHIYKWDNWSAHRIGARALPQTMGHEVAGEVVEKGKAVKKISIGDYVSAETHIPFTGDLQYLLGQAHLGEKLQILGVDRDGVFAEYVAVPEIVCWINDRSIPPEFATIQEPLGNAAYAVLGEDNDVAGKSMVIIGDGPIGLFATGVARAVGVTNIFLVGISDYALEIGRRMGADHVLFANDNRVNRVAYIKDHTYGYGADIVVEAVGVPQAIDEGFKMLRKGGRFSAFGVTSEEKVPLDYNDGIVFKGCQIHGISGRKMFDTWYRVRNLLSSKRLDISAIVTHELALDEFKIGFEKMLELPRRTGKIILFPSKIELDAARKRQPVIT
jgi:threonine 3-dehydrogenase